MIWQKEDIDSGAVRSLSERFGVDLLTATILARRGVTDPAAIQFHLEDDLKNLPNPFLFEGMVDAVERIMTARSEGERVLVFGDRDVDGITSIALTVETLTDLGILVDWKLPMGDDPYGLTTGVIDEFAAADGTLIIAVDCGTSSMIEIAYALERGIDTIVVDHHNPQDALPPAAAIINPKLQDSGYPFAGLCACGLAAKLRWALAFAQTDFYNQPVCLLNVRPGNETLIVEAVKLENLVEVDRLIENVVPGMVDLDRTRIVPFLEGQQILVYDAPAQDAMLRRIFGPNVEVGLLDIAPEVWKLFPALRDRSLLAMRPASRLARYASQIPEEIDVLAGLFTSFVFKRIPELIDRFEKSLDLVALGTLADMMPLQNENLVLARVGLRVMQATTRPGLRELLARTGVSGRPLTAKEIGWQVAPVINASGRMGEPDKAVKLLLSRDPGEIGQLVTAVTSMNDDRKRSGEDAWERVLPQAYRSFEELDNRFVVVTDDSIQRGITGIIAGRLARLFNVPAAVVALLPQKSVGSIRTARGFAVTEFLSMFSDIFSDWGGHDSAGGFHMVPERLGEFVGRIPQVLHFMHLADEEDEKLLIDAELPLDFVTPKLFDVEKVFAPSGQENPPLTFLARGLRIAQLDLMGRETQNHVKFLLDTGSVKWPAVFWNAAERVGRDFTADDQLDVVFQLSKNLYQGRETPQLLVVDARRAGTKSVSQSQAAERKRLSDQSEDAAE
ncbi:MAG TPA: single-stranded-DNA-specific exonuclease RecJ [Spirochaetia bacterium]|nr:single-stranded-DNA-specific exonuclease RecJ [Spirochaetia bacterium]